MKIGNIKIDCRLWFPILIMILISAIYLILHQISIEQRSNYENYIRTVFVRGCAKDRWEENDVIKWCNDEYEKYHQIELRNWKPIENKNN